jgi:HEAT repeat protein
MVSAELLFMINPKDALLFVDKLMDDDNIWNRIRLIELLNEVHEPEATELLKKLTKDSDDMVRERAESILEEKQTRI